MNADTIAAIATAPGTAAISIVRVSGSDALAIADRVFEGNGPAPSERPGGSFAHGMVHSAADAGPDTDEVILLIYRAPHSYTREDVVEFQGHGGRVAARRLLQAVVSAGARPAEAGEFTRRAFLSGRIDLVQAEAVMDLIAAQSDRAAQIAVDQIEGSLSVAVAAVYRSCISTSADVSALLDFAEDDVVANLSPAILDRVSETRKAILAILDTWREGHILREGVLAVICGRPNTGKSTLMNALLATHRAIVTRIPGTTRDTIEEGFEADGVPIRLVDTAGIRDADCEIEREGVLRSHGMMDRADLILYVIDASVPLDKSEKARLRRLPVESTVLVLNKLDLGRNVADAALCGHVPIETTLVNDGGIEGVRAAILHRIGVAADSDQRMAISERHRELLTRADGDLAKAQTELQSSLEHLAPAALFLRSATEAVGEILGKTYTADLLDTVFSRFCIGK